MTYPTKILNQLLFTIIISILSIIDGESISNLELTKIKGRIVNGSKVLLGEFSYIVSLRRSNSMTLFCAGNIINERWILTAAHCMFDDKYKLISPQSIVVVGGELKLFSQSLKRQKRHVMKRILNPQYDKNHLTNDIALLLLNNSFEINSYLKITHWSLTMTSPGKKCIAAGWGYREETNSWVSNDLRYIELPVLHEKLCKKLMGDIIYVLPSMFCAGYEEGGRDTCQGDSGGPLECDGLLTGIVSGGTGCAREKRPGYYTNVSFYTNWIEQVIDSNGLNTSYNGVLEYTEVKTNSTHTRNTLNTTDANSVNFSIILIINCSYFFLTFVFT